METVSDGGPMHQNITLEPPRTGGQPAAPTTARAVAAHRQKRCQPSRFVAVVACSGAAGGGSSLAEFWQAGEVGPVSGRRRRGRRRRCRWRGGRGRLGLGRSAWWCGGRRGWRLLGRRVVGRRVPLIETNRLGADGQGLSRSRRSRYPVSALTVLECSRISRDLPYLESRTMSSPLALSRSSRSRRMASEMRSPVAATSPMSVGDRTTFRLFNWFIWRKSGPAHRWRAHLLERFPQRRSK
jgi:hypothetical protein